MIDSLGPRKFKDMCDSGWLVPPELRAQDAVAAAYLRSRPEIVPDRIGVIGFLHGGSSALAAASARVTPFQAAIAFYPYCPAATDRIRFSTDTLIHDDRRGQHRPAACASDQGLSRRRARLRCRRPGPLVGQRSSDAGKIGRAHV